MKTFLVKRDIGDTSMIDVFGMSAASHRCAADMRNEGDRIYYLGSTYLPDEGLCLCLFEAKNAEVVADHSRAARLPVQQIVSAVAFGLQPVPLSS